MKKILTTSAIAITCMACNPKGGGTDSKSDRPIVDRLENAEQYYALHPRLQQAFEFLNSVDLDTLPLGRHDIDGSDIFMTVSMSPLKDTADAKLEVHNVYIDIQLALGGDTESFGWSPRSKVTDTIDAFDTASDIQFFREQPQVYFPLHRGMFTIFMPEDAHAPQIGEGLVKKAVVKVRV